MDVSSATRADEKWLPAGSLPYVLGILSGLCSVQNHTPHNDEAAVGCAMSKLCRYGRLEGGILFSELCNELDHKAVLCDQTYWQRRQESQTLPLRCYTKFEERVEFVIIAGVVI